MSGAIPTSAKPPSVSAVIVVRNGERFLADALQSIRQQTRPPDEVLVVDGQSTDRTAQIARFFPGVHTLLQPDLGIANACIAVKTWTGSYTPKNEDCCRWLGGRPATASCFRAGKPQPARSTLFAVKRLLDRRRAAMKREP